MQCLWEFDPTNGRREDAGMSDFLAKNLAFLLKGDKSAQAAIAHKAQTTQPTISKWSRLQGEPGFRSMARLCAAIGVSMDDLAFRDIREYGLSEVSQPARLDIPRLSVAIGALDTALDNLGLDWTPEAKAEVVSHLYSEFAGTIPSPAEAVAAALRAIGKSLKAGVK